MSISFRVRARRGRTLCVIGVLQQIGKKTMPVTRVRLQQQLLRAQEHNLSPAQDLVFIRNNMLSSAESDISTAQVMASLSWDLNSVDDASGVV